MGEDASGERTRHRFPGAAEKHPEFISKAGPAVRASGVEVTKCLVKYAVSFSIVGKTMRAAPLAPERCQQSKESEDALAITGHPSVPPGSRTPPPPSLRRAVLSSVVPSAPRLRAGGGAVGDENAEEHGRGDGPPAVRAAFAEGALRLGKAGGTLCAVSA